MDALVTLERVRAAVPVAELANFYPIGLVDEYVRFLTLKVLRRDFDALPPELSPSHPVDTVWHSQMLLPAAVTPSAIDNPTVSTSVMNFAVRKKSGVTTEAVG
jgi:hypothetical protein